MDVERTVFEERGDRGSVRLLAIGDLTPDLLAAVEGFVGRQRCRQISIAAGDAEVASWIVSDPIIEFRGDLNVQHNRRTQKDFGSKEL